MTRRKPRHGQAIPRQNSVQCPCGTGKPYRDCCRPLHAGERSAPTAEALMRARYSAFAVGDAAFLSRTWHPNTRPSALELDDPKRWTGLEVLETSGGSAFHTAATVTFRAHYVHRGDADNLHEKSRFTRLDGEWVYVDAEFTE